MSKYLRRRSSRLILSGLAGCALATFAAQAEDTNAPTVLKPTVVTGSLIPSAETVGAQPVESVRTEDIQKVATQDVLQTLKKLSSAFSGNANVGQTINNRTQGGGEANVAIRNLPTLVLLDGRRLAPSSFSFGSAIDVNTIPISMIERVEVLKDGGSTFYGSDAIGGVVNVISKKNFDGTEISGHVGFPTRDTSNDLIEHRESIVSGFSNEKGSFTAGLQYYYMDPLLTQDRHTGSASATELVANNMALPTYYSGSFPGRVGNFVLAGSEFVKGSPLYNPAYTTPPVAGGPYTINQLVGMGVYVPIDETPGGIALINAGQAGARVLLNTTRYGTYSIQQQDRKNAFFNFERSLYEDTVKAFGNFYFANNLAQGILAPSPISALGPAGYNNIAIPANNPFNPFGIALGQGGSASPRIRARTVEVGNRLFDSQYDYYRMVAGLRGTVAKDYNYELAYSYNRSEQLQYNRNIPAGDRLNQALQPNSDPALAAQGLSNLADANGNYVPVFNIFGIGPSGTGMGANSPATISALRSTTFDSGISELWSMDGKVDGKIIDLPGGRSSFAVGASYVEESIRMDSDAMLESGSAPGLNPIPSFPKRARTRWSVFGEVLIPITAPDMDIPGVRSFEIDVSGRHETLDPGGDANVPKVAVRWQPLDEQVTLRASYSQSFIAPTLFQLYGPPTADVPDITFPDAHGQVNALYLSNPNLPPATADTWNGGIVVTPKFVPNLTVSVDYYNVNEKEIGATPDINEVVRDLNARGPASRYSSGYISAAGTRVTGPNQVFFSNADPTLEYGSFSWLYEPGASQSTEGLDFAMNYGLPVPEEYGKFTVWGNANWTFNYEFQGAPTLPRYNYAGFYTTGVLGAQGTMPSWTVNCGLTWDIWDFTLNATAHYIPPVQAPGSLWPTVGGEVNENTINGAVWQIQDWWSIDLQVAYEIGKTKTEKAWYDNTRIAVGVNNITDEDPPFIAGSPEDNSDKSTYDIMGRFIYFEISKRF